MTPNPTPIQQARHRIETLWADTVSGDTRESRIVSAKENDALRTVLDEIHRLNLAIAKAGKSIRSAKKQAPRTTSSTNQKRRNA